MDEGGGHLTAEKVDQIIREHKMTVSRYKYLMNVIDELKRQAEIWSRHIAEDIVTLGNQTIDGMPHGTTVGNPTEKFGIMLASGFTPAGLKELKGEIARLENEAHEKSVNIRIVEAWLDGLSEKERWLVEKQVIDGAYWREVIAEYHRRYGEEYSKEGLKRIRDNAMAKIHQTAL